MDNFGIKKMEFAKDDINKNTAKPSGQGTMKLGRLRFFRSRVFIIIVVVLLFFVLSGLYFGIQAFAIYQGSQKTYKQAKLAYDAAKKQNVVLTREELVKTKESIDDLKKQYSSVSFLKYIPLFGVYIGDADHLLNAARRGVAAAIITTDSLIPYADVLGLKGEKSFVMGSAEDRIRLAVKTIGKVVPKIDLIEVELVAAKEEIDQVNPARYPNFWVFKKVRTQIERVRTLADDGVIAVEQGKPFIKVLPALLGESSEKRYLVLFQNDKEQRPTGGFMTFYAIFRVQEGLINVERSSDIYTLDASIPSHPRAPEIILKYLPKVNTYNIRDSNLSPDFVESMKEFNKLYEKSNSRVKVDGIIALDTHVLVHILEILGEVSAAGTTFKPEKDSRCNCPQAVYVLEEFADRPVNFVREGRKAIIGELLYEIMKKALSSSPKLYWGKLFQQGLKDIQNKHILFYMYNNEAQKGIESLNWSGKIKEFEGDYLHINDANFGGAKANMYVKPSVKMEYETKNGEITKTITITYRNPQPHSDCNLERGGLCLNAILRNYQRVYVPVGSILVQSKGSEVKVNTGKDLGKTMFDGFFTVKPLGKSEVTYTYKLPFKVQGSTLPVLIQKQPGVDFIPFEIVVNGKKTQSFDLTTDKTITLTI